MSRAGKFCLAVLVCAWTAPAHAHRPSDAFLTLNLQEQLLSGQWEIALRDLEALAAVDADGDGAITWGELRGAQNALAVLLQGALQVAADGKPCALQVTDLLVNDRVDGPYAWFALEGDCPKEPAALGFNYRLLFDLDPTHRGILVLSAGAIIHSAVLSPERSRQEFVLGETSAWRQFSDYLREGVHHIWIGLDHILFLVSLLLPCVLLRANRGWQGVAHLRTALWDVFGVVSAFTVAHSITLTLAALDVLRLPSALVESVIALSVLLAALNNLFPVVTRRRWAVAFVFGLIHGFGFASVLGELGLPQGARLLSLLAFNLGVELGQLAIVAAAVPLAYVLRNRWAYRHIVLTGGSLVIAAVAGWWFVQRAGLTPL